MEVWAPQVVSTDTTGGGNLIFRQPDESPASLSLSLSLPSVTPLGRGCGKGLGCSLQPEVKVSAPYLAFADGGGATVFPVLFGYSREINT